MPLEPYPRGKAWWARGRVELDGQPITDYLRISTGASTEAGAREWIAEETARIKRRHIVGDEPDTFTFDDAVLIYRAKPAEAKRLLRVLPELNGRAIATITPKEVRALGPKLMPECATDTWWREIVTPVRSVINNAHEEGYCPPVKIRGYSTQERVAQDEARGKASRVEKTPADRAWIEAFAAHADPYNAALAEFMFETAARISQAVKLEPQHLDLMKGRVWLAASKGHPAQWVAISRAMVVRLANLKAKAPRPRKGEKRGKPVVFGYARPTSMHSRWRTICKKAGIQYIPPHAAGRHGFYTEMRVRQRHDPITAAKAGRWADPALPDRIYAHSDADERAIREQVRTNRVQDTGKPPRKSKKRKRKA